MERITPEGLTAPRRKSALSDEMTGSMLTGRAPVVSRIPLLKPSSEVPHQETARPRPAGMQMREAPRNSGQQAGSRGPWVDEPRLKEAGDPRMGFVVDTRWDEGPGPASLPAAPPAWLTQLTRWQWNSTLLAISLVLVSGIIMSAWRQRDAAIPPAQLAMPEIHYHVESLRQQDLVTAESVSPTRHDVRNVTMPELPVTDQSTAVALTTQTEPTRRRPKAGPAVRTVREDSQSASHFESMEYPETKYPDYSATARRNRTNVRLDGQIQEYK